MSSSTPSNSSSIGTQIRSGLKGIHGAGEAIRGTVLAETDKAFGTADTPEAMKNEAIAQKGVDDVKRADRVVGEHHGVKGPGGQSGVNQRF